MLVNRVLEAAGISPPPVVAPERKMKEENLEKKIVNFDPDSARKKLPVVKETFPGYIPSQALMVYLHELSEYERKEIPNYRAIYTIGDKMSKQFDCHIDKNFTTPKGEYIISCGDHIGYRYIMERMIGEGSYSQVFLCNDKRTDQRVAVKMMKKIRQSVYKEIKILSKILENDPDGESNCIRILDFDHFRNHFFIVSDYYSMDLGYYLSKRKVRMMESGRMMRSVLQALVFLGNHNIVHGDLKPANILLDPYNPHNLKIADFGLATFAPKKMGKEVYQSRYYRAPEVFCQGIITTAIDMWSFGCIMAEIHLRKPYLNGIDDFEQFLIIQQYFGQPPDSYFEECSNMESYFDLKTKKPKCCAETKNPITGQIRVEMDPLTSMLYPTRSSSEEKKRNLNTDFKGHGLTPLREFLGKCFLWTPQSRILPSVALNLSLFSRNLRF